MTALPAKLLARLGIAWRLVVGTAPPIVLFILFAGWLWGALSQVQDTLRTSDDGVEYAFLAKDMQRNVVEVQQFLQDVSATRGQDGLDTGFAEAQRNHDQFLASLERFKSHFVQLGQTDEVRQLDTIRSNFAQYYQTGVTMAQAYVKDGPSGGNPHMDSFDKASAALQGHLVKFVDERLKVIQDNSSSLSALTRGLRWTAVLICGLCAVVSVAVSLVLANSILHPVRKAVRVVKQVSQGDLVTPIRSSGNDELAVLLQALSEMQARLRDLMTGLHVNAHHVDSASMEIAHGNSDMADRTEQQASALVEISSAIQQIEATVISNMNHVQNANQLAVETERVADQGGTVVHEFVSTMRGINDSSRRIGDIIGVIDSIAFQTNILALNAAVEAARAGEQGRGFAVVASEVRTLAQRSATAAREIKELVTDSVARVEQGSRLVDHAGATMNEVMVSVSKMTTLMRELDTSAATQITGVSQVALAVRQLEQNTQQNATLAEQSSRAADSLKQQSTDMVAAMSQFQYEA